MATSFFFASHPQSTQMLRTARDDVEYCIIRDLTSHPLTPAEFLENPLAFLHVELQAAWYEPGCDKPFETISRPFGPTLTERVWLSRAVADWATRPIDGLLLRVCAVSLSGD